MNLPYRFCRVSKFTVSVIRCQNRRVRVRDTTKIINEGLTIEEHWKERFILSLCARLGFQKSRGALGRAVILWNDKLIERLKKDKRYASCFTPDLSETPSESSELPQPF